MPPDEESTDYWDVEESDESTSTESSTSLSSSDMSQSSEVILSSLSSEPSSMTGRGRLSHLSTKAAPSRSSQPPIGPRPPRKITLEDDTP